MFDVDPEVGTACGRVRGRWGRVAHGGVPFALVVDGEAVPDVPWRALSDGRAAAIELLTGHTRDEYRLFLAVSGRLGTTTERDTSAALRRLAPGAGGERAHRSGYPTLGACHALDLPLLFGTDSPVARILLGNDGPPAAALAVGDQIRRGWTAFAAHGDPGWPATGPTGDSPVSSTPIRAPCPTRRRPPGGSGTGISPSHSTFA